MERCSPNSRHLPGASLAAAGKKSSNSPVQSFDRLAHAWSAPALVGGLHGSPLNQRALNGGLDPRGVGSANLGRPIFAPISMPNMTGRPGYWTMEMNGGSSAPVPRLCPLRSLVCTSFNKGGSKGVFKLPGAGGDHFHCAVEPSPGHIRRRQFAGKCLF